jgi:cholesterol oxidase
MIYDYIVIGSGFGGSVASLRLVEKEYKVLLLEQGKRFLISTGLPELLYSWLCKRLTML